MAAAPLSPGAFMTEVSEDKSTPSNSPSRMRNIERAAADAALLASPSSSQAAAAAAGGAAARLVAVALRDELSAARSDFIDRLDVAFQAQRVSEEAALQATSHSRRKDLLLLEMSEEVERKSLTQRELNARWQIAIGATGERACAVNRALRHELRARNEANRHLQEKLDVAVRRLSSMEVANDEAQRLIDGLRLDLAKSSVGGDESRHDEPDGAEADASSSGVATPTEQQAPSALPMSGGRVSTAEVAASMDVGVEAALRSMQEANRGLAERIAIVRAEHNAMSDRFDGETKRADEALAALRDAELEIEELRAQLDEAVDSVDDASAPTKQRPGAAGSTLVEVPEHLVDKLQSVGGVAGLFSQLSERTQLIAEIDDENRRLKEETMLLEARCVTTETRLHHHVEEGAATSILLERGIGRMKAKLVGDADGAETRKTLTQAAMTLRRALEREGYDTTALPLAPDPGLDLPYLRQILSDHADMCSSHFTRGATGSIVPSATRKPLVYSSGRN